MIDVYDKDQQERYRHRWFGKYRAFVRDNNDPERLGRCRLEIPAVLGKGKDHWSDWASPCFPYGGNQDIGMFLVPEEGASVWAEFEGGDVQYPIWVGVWLARSNPGEQPEEAKRLCGDAKCLDCEDKADHQANPSDHEEHGKFHGHPDYYCPRRKVLLKTETGHSIVADDKDEEEFLAILDRGGQMMRFECPVLLAKDRGNALPRRTRQAEAGDQLDIGSDIKDQKARVEITDLCRQFVRWEAWKDREKIWVQSNDKGRGRIQRVLLDTTKGRERVVISGLNFRQEIIIDSTAGREHILVRDKAGSVVWMDAVNGNITVDAKNFVFINP
ncbi:MAG: baseplate assembly protein V [Planctomycetes bacterium]|nr:baseplate assembly protein V [Planctomycetota bacterium]